MVPTTPLPPSKIKNLLLVQQCFLIQTKFVYDAFTDANDFPWVKAVRKCTASPAMLCIATFLIKHSEETQYYNILNDGKEILYEGFC